MYEWIDDILEGIEDTYNVNDIKEIYDSLEIEIIKLEPGNVLLKGNESFYYRSFFNKEVVFIRNDLHEAYEKFILAHELGHALLHTNICQAAFNKGLLNLGKLERQANYFAFRLLNLDIDRVEFDGMTLEQISVYLGIPCEPLEQLL